MYNAERVHRIDQLLHERRVVTTAFLLETLGVSRATLKRDLEFMRDRLNAPIVYDRERGGYRFDKQGVGPRYALPGLWFNDAEAAALLTMNQLLQELDNGLLTPHVQPLVSRIDAILGDGQIDSAELRRRIRIVRPGARRPANDLFPGIALGLLQRRRLHISYYARGRAESSERVVSPQRLVHYRNNWYLDAWCHLRSGLRSFALDSIRAMRVEDERADEVADDTLDRFFKSGYGMFSGTAVRWARLRFDAGPSRWAKDERWHSQQRGTLDDAGRFTLELPFTDPTELLGDVMKYGGGVEVLSPPELREQFCDQLRQTLTLNGG